MRNLVVSGAVFAVIVTAVVVGIVSQRRARTALQAEAAQLRRSNAALVAARQENVRQKAELAVDDSPAREGVAVSQGETGPAAAEHRDPTQGMVKVELFQPAGHATPAAAFETMVWAALQGRDDVLADTLTMSAAARTKLVELLSRMEPATRKKVSTPEAVPALLLAEEILRKALSLHISGVEMAGDDGATLTARMTSRTGQTSTSRFTLRRVEGRWRIALEDGMIDAMIRSLGQPNPPEPGRP
jgi:high-affinity K+ transport system ATPase subunit B